MTSKQWGVPSWGRVAVRSLAALLVLMLPLVLWWGGARPEAVGLVPSPWDKLLHAAVFAVVVVAWAHASGTRGWCLTLAAVLFALLVGGMDEWHQSHLPGRHAGWDDLAADVFGALAGCWVVERYRRRKVGHRSE
jgi:VanZ family protein